MLSVLLVGWTLLHFGKVLGAQVSAPNAKPGKLVQRHPVNQGQSNMKAFSGGTGRRAGLPACRPGSPEKADVVSGNKNPSLSGPVLCREMARFCSAIDILTNLTNLNQFEPI